jgi:hypothetical protein
MEEVAAEKMLRSQLVHFVMDLISHGRHFNAYRDKVVIRKCVDYLMELINDKR